MTQVAVVYFSGTGTTARVASGVCAGVAGTDVAVLDAPIVGSDIVEGRWRNDDISGQLDNCAGIIFGSPTYMGSTSAQLKAFFDAMAPRWYTQAWRNKVAAGFSASALPAGDKSTTFIAMTTFAMQMGMIWCGSGAATGREGSNPLGFYLGAGIAAADPETVTEADLNLARHLGKRVAELCLRLDAAS